MKKLFLILLLIPFIGKAQLTDSASQKILRNQQIIENRMITSGNELVKCQTLMGAGIGFGIIGGIVAILGSNTLSKDQIPQGYSNQEGDVNGDKTIIYTGIGISAIGFIMSMAAIDHIGKAGIKLKGNGIIIQLN